MDTVTDNEQHAILCAMHKERIKLCLSEMAKLAEQLSDLPSYSHYERLVTLIDWHRREASRHHEAVSKAMNGRYEKHPDKSKDFRPHPIVTDERIR